MLLLRLLMLVVLLVLRLLLVLVLLVLLVLRLLLVLLVLRLLLLVLMLVLLVLLLLLVLLPLMLLLRGRIRRAVKQVGAHRLWRRRTALSPTLISGVHVHRPGLGPGAGGWGACEAAPHACRRSLRQRGGVRASGRHTDTVWCL